MGKRKRSKLKVAAAASSSSMEENGRIDEEAKAAVLVSSSATNLKKKKINNIHSTINSLLNNNSSSLEIIEKWKQILTLQDTLTIILSYIPEYLLNRTMRFVNRDFDIASTVVKNEFKNELKIRDISSEQINNRIEIWKKFKKLKFIKIAFIDDLFCEEFDVSYLSDFEIEILKIFKSISTISKSLIGSKLSENLKYLEIDLDRRYFNMLFDLSIHTLKIKFQKDEDDENDKITIESDEKPLFTSLTDLSYSYSSFSNMEIFISRLVNLEILNNNNDDPLDERKIKLPNLKSYSCFHILTGIKHTFPNLQDLKSYFPHPVSTSLQALSLKTLKSVTLNVDSNSFNLLPDSLFDLPLLEKLSLLINCYYSIDEIIVKPKPLNNLRELWLTYIECDGSLPISCAHFSKCSNIEIIEIEDEKQQLRVDFNDFLNFPILKKLSIISRSISNWNNTLSNLESLKINITSKDTVSLTGLDKLKHVDFVSGNMNALVQYLNESPRNSIRNLKISGKDISKYNSQYFPSNLENLTFTNLSLKGNIEPFANLIKQQTTLVKLVIEESKFDLIQVLESLTCLIHQVRKIQVSGECFPTPYSESKYITKLLQLLSVFDSKNIHLKLIGFNFTFSSGGTHYLLSQIDSRFTTISFT